jgi:hypothetical protein
MKFLVKSWLGKLLIFSLLVAVAIAIVTGLAADRVAAQSSQARRICVNGLLYRSTFSDGQPIGERTDVSAQAAAQACEFVTTREEASEVRRCVNGLLYTSTFSDGQPTGQRTNVSDRAAVQACSSIALIPDDGGFGNERIEIINRASYTLTYRLNGRVYRLRPGTRIRHRGDDLVMEVY